MRKDLFFTKKAVFILLLCIISSYFVSGCFANQSGNDDNDFWSDAELIDGYDNLYLLHNIAFEGQPYNNIANLGDSILLVGQGEYNNSMEYSFEIYNPDTNEIEYSLSHSDTNCDSYEIHGDKLWLINYQTDSLSIYDAKLNLIDSSSYSAVTGPECEDTTNSHYTPTYIGSSYDYRYSLFYGIDKDTYKYSVYSVDNKKNKVVDSVFGQSFSFGDLDDDSLFYCEDVDNSIWNFHTLSNGDCLFNMTDIHEATPLKDDSIYIRQHHLASSGNPENTFYCYQFSKKNNITSSFSFDLSLYSPSTNAFVSTNSAYLKEYNCIMFLLYTEDCNPEILIWKLNGTNNTESSITYFDNEDDLISYMKEKDIYISEDNQTEYTVTQITDSDYDWGELAGANNRACELEDSFDISIYLGEEVPSVIDIYGLTQETDVSKIDSSLDILENILRQYPDDFLSELCYGSIKGIRVYLCSDISGLSGNSISSASGFVLTVDNHLVMVLDVNYDYDWTYTINHELSHMIDKKLSYISEYNPNCSFSEETWQSYNPKSFSYAESYIDYEDNTEYDLYSDYFLDSYSLTYPTEDRAVLFGTCMQDYFDDNTNDSNFGKGTPLYSKMKYYTTCIRENFNSVKNSETLPWEIMFQ